MSHFPIGCETLIATPSFHLVRFSGGWRSARLDLAPGKFSPKLGVAEKELNEPLDAIPGVRVERKRFSIAVHYRHGEEIGVTTIRQALNESARHRELRIIAGKKVFELQPNIEWDKGKAVLWLLETLGLEGRNMVSIYIGDDNTDEDAFRALEKRGVAILVGEQSQPTTARYWLKNPGEVERFLRAVTECVGREL